MYVTNYLTMSQPNTKSNTRIASLDVLRGMTIALMLLVNNVPAGVKNPLQFQHAAWGEMIHLADLVFPWLLFCAGVSIPLARAAFLRRRQPERFYYLRIVRRTITLFGLGCLLQSSLAGQWTLSLGVLQLIALASLVAAVMGGWPRRYRLLLALMLLVAYWVVIKYTMAPGQQAGVITETDNMIRYLNENVFGPYNLWGLPSLIPTTALVLLGTLAGDWVRSTHASELQKATRLLVGGGLLAYAGILWSQSIPLSKAIWSPTYILLTAGLAYCALGLLYVLVDWVGLRVLAYPFLVLGSNAIFAYVAPILVKVFVLRRYTNWEHMAQASLVHHLGVPVGLWTYTGLFILSWWLIIWVMYRKNWLLRA